MDSKFEFLYNFDNIENDIEFKELCNRYKLDVIEVIKKLDSVYDLNHFKSYIYEVYKHNTEENPENDINNFNNQYDILCTHAINLCPTFANIIGGGGSRMKNRNIPKHYAKCNTCEKYMTIIDDVKNNLKKARNKVYLIRDNYNNITKIIEIFERHLIKYIYKHIILDIDNIERVFYSVRGYDTMISLTDIYESIIMDNAKKSFYKNIIS